jgi:DNA-binding transcriptional ArsR family regulator
MTARQRIAAIERLLLEGRTQGASAREMAEKIADLPPDTSWAKAVSHPLRAEILRMLRDGPLSPVRASEHIHSAQLSVISYHFRYLQRLGLIEVMSHISRRGAVEHVYRLAG